MVSGGADIVGNCTADLGVKVADEYQDILDFLRTKLPNTHVVIMAILPKVQCSLARCSVLPWTKLSPVAATACNVPAMDRCVRVPIHWQAFRCSSQSHRSHNHPAMWLWQGEVWPNRCSTAINTANELLQKSVEGQERMHYIDMGPVCSGPAQLCWCALSRQLPEGDMPWSLGRVRRMQDASNVGLQAARVL